MSTDLLLYGVSATALIIGLVAVARQAGMPVRFAPLLDVVLGILAGLAEQYHQSSPDWIAGVVLGIALGLSASGVFAGAKTTFARVPPVPPPAN